MEARDATGKATACGFSFPDGSFCAEQAPHLHRGDDEFETRPFVTEAAIPRCWTGRPLRVHPRPVAR